MQEFEYILLHSALLPYISDECLDLQALACEQMLKAWKAKGIQRETLTPATWTPLAIRGYFGRCLSEYWTRGRECPVDCSSLTAYKLLFDNDKVWDAWGGAFPEHKMQFLADAVSMFNYGRNRGGRLAAEPDILAGLIDWANEEEYGKAFDILWEGSAK